MRVRVAHGEPEPFGPDGCLGALEPWPYVMAYGAQVSFADDAGDLVSVIIDGYDRIPDTDEGHDQASFLRAAALADIGNAVQGAIIEQAVEAGSFEPATESEQVLTALGQDRRIPFCGITSGAGTSVHWTHRVPLVVMRTHYEPFTGRTAPTGNLLVLDPSTEVTFLESLAPIGLVRLLIGAKPHGGLPGLRVRCLGS